MSVMRRRQPAQDDGNSLPPGVEPPPGYYGKMPFYGLSVNKKGYAVAGGGGGASRTGIPNGLVFFKCLPDELERIGGHDTKSNAIESLDIHPDDTVVVYVEQDKFVKLKFAAGGTVLTTEPIQNTLAKNTKVIRFSPDGSKIALGSYDGALSVVSFPALTTVAHSATAHTKSIDDVCWDPTGKLLATASKEDKACKLWSVETGNIRSTHTFTCEADGQKLITRGCKFSPTQPNQLFVSAFVLSKSTYVFVWNTATGSLIKKSKIHNTHTTCFAISAKGTYVAVGDVEGSIIVALADNLQKILQVKPHGFIIPAVAFTPPPTTTQTPQPSRSTSRRSSTKRTSAPPISSLSTDSTAVISAGADNACMFTPIVKQSFVNVRLILLIISILVVLFAVFIRMLRN